MFDRAWDRVMNRHNFCTGTDVPRTSVFDDRWSRIMSKHAEMEEDRSEGKAAITDSEEEDNDGRTSSMDSSWQSMSSSSSSSSADVTDVTDAAEIEEMTREVVEDEATEEEEDTTTADHESTSDGTTTTMEDNEWESAMEGGAFDDTWDRVVLRKNQYDYLCDEESHIVPQQNEEVNDVRQHDVRQHGGAAADAQAVLRHKPYPPHQWPLLRESLLGLALMFAVVFFRLGQSQSNQMPIQLQESSSTIPPLSGLLIFTTIGIQSNRNNLIKRGRTENDVMRGRARIRSTTHRRSQSV